MWPSIPPLIVALALFVCQVVAGPGQIPVVDGVIGGVARGTNGAVSGRAKTGLEGRQTTPGALRVTENSGICETTGGVYQASGYGDLTSSESIWFWLFESRNDPDNAPLSIWLNGGPGSSSMIGLLQENGPCRIRNDSSDVDLNPNSWNEVSNMLFIDQPVGVGYSHGDTNVGTSQEAAADVWKFLQIFFSDSRFSKYQSRPFAIWTESYGGHYGPVFAHYFLQQNEAISNGSASGLPINLQVLGVGDGLTDPATQYPGYVTYATSNPYHPLVDTSTIDRAETAMTESGGCADQIDACNNGGSDSVCSDTQSFCNANVLGPLAGDWDVYYVPTANPDPYPPDISAYLNNASVMSAIGAESPWQMSNGQVYTNFANTGDWMRTSKGDLEAVINAGVRTIIYDGDADFILNFNGVEAMVNSLSTQYSAEYAQQSFANYTVAGQVMGVYKNAGQFSYVRIFGAGHEVPAYTYGGLQYGQAALQMFTQVMAGQGLSPT